MDEVVLPKVSVIITTYNRPISLGSALYSLRSQTHTDFDDLEVIIQNDGSSLDYTDIKDGIGDLPFKVAYTEYPRLEGNRPNLYVLKNLAAEYARNEVLWFLGDDNIVDDHSLFILRLYFALLPWDDTVLLPHLANPEDPLHYQAAFTGRVAPSPNSGAPKCSHYVSFEGLAMRKKLFNDVAIDETFTGSMGFADLDFGHRLWLYGAKICEVDGIQVFMKAADSEERSHRDRILERDQREGDAHKNGRYFIEKWGPEVAALYGVVWDENDRQQFGWFWNGASFEKE